jgi:hypothetical protein
LSQLVMYPAKSNSPKTVLSSAVTASAATIYVADVSVFPEAPNLATIGSGDNAEVILYTSIGTGSLTGCTRGISGTTASIWAADSEIGRYFTAYDHDTFKANMEDLDSVKLAKTGNGSSVTAAFTAAASRTAIVTGETLAVLFGKILKWLSDLKALAFKATVATADIDASAVTNAKLASMAAKTLKGNSGTGAAAPADIAAADALAMIGACADDDSRLSDARTPTSHASTHAAGGSDAVTPASIGAATPIAYTTASSDAITLADNAIITRTEATAVTITYPTGNYICTVVLTFAASGTFSVTFPAGTTYLGSIPTWTASVTYEISVRNGVAAIGEVGTGA